MPSLAKKCLWVMAASLPALLFVFKFSILNRNRIFLGEDWDYFAQAYEAARQSILHYHQFPWWNPWVNGGQPLFANPQFGLFSIQMPLVLIFGTVQGLHLSILAYYLLGFWGMYLLLLRLGARTRVLALLLSYVWVFAAFNVWHLGGGQITFALYLIVPWIFLAQLNIRRRYGWLWFSLAISLLINSAMHYLSVEVLCISAFLAIAQFIRVYKLGSRPQQYELFKRYAITMGIIILLCAVRMYYTFQFMHEYPRMQPLDRPTSLSLFTGSLLFRHQLDPAPLQASGVTDYGWDEYGNYFGLITVALFVYALVRSLGVETKLKWRDWTLVLGILLAALLVGGAFAKYSPYAVLHELPVFNQMRVPSRFTCWILFGVILFLRNLPARKAIYVLLAISIVDVFTANYHPLNYNQQPYVQPAKINQRFEQYAFFDSNPNKGFDYVFNNKSLRLLRATQSNAGEVYGYEPILNVNEYYFLPGTSRCGVQDGCNFVLTKNARVTYWSPQKISLQRTGPGIVKLNMNPGQVWAINGAHPFKADRVLELQSDFVISDPAKNITVQFTPSI